MLDFCSTGKPHYKVPHYNVVFNIHVTCQYNKLSLIVCDYGPQRQKYTTWLTCTFYGALLKIGSQNQNCRSLLINSSRTITFKLHMLPWQCSEKHIYKPFFYNFGSFFQYHFQLPAHANKNVLL